MIRKIKSILLSPEYTLRERLFLLGSIVGVMVLLMVGAVTYVTSGSFAVIVGFPAIIAVFALLVVYSFRKRSINLGGTILILFINCVVYPLAYLEGGAAYSGSPVWFAICIVYIFMVFKGRIRAVLTLLSVATYGAVAYFAYLHPEYVKPLATKSMVYADTFLASVIVAVTLGLLLAFVSSIYDKQAEELEKQKEELDKLNKAQNRFFSSMSHEIRTPINTIIGLNEMILRDNQISQDVSENAQNIQNASKMLLSLINDILDLSKIESGRMEVVESQYETSRMFSEIVNLLWTRAREKGLAFEMNVGDNIPSMLYGDEMRIKQVIVNILTNAIKYTEKGSVTLTVDGEKTSANGFLLRIDVKDTGMGIRKENIPYLFNSFKRVEEQENKTIEGTGLGLAISKQLMDLMGGRITVDSIYTKGSDFHIELPQKIVDESPMNFSRIESADLERPVYEQSFEAPEAHVLIVDDNDMNRMVVRKLLRGTKVNVDLAAGGRECLAKTKEVSYDAIFMDHEMPGMDGVETLVRVRAQQNGLCRNTPVIALTANAGSDMHDFYMSHGFQAYLAKPINGALLEVTLLQFLPAELIEKSAAAKEGDSFQVSQNLRKRSVIITTDSLCDMPDSVINLYGIRRMPYFVVTEEGRFRDVDEMDSDNMFSYAASGRKISAQAGTVEEYETFFADALEKAEKVIHIAASSKASDAFDNALAASKSFGNVIVYDSQHLTSALGMMVAKAGELAREGKIPADIIDELDWYKDRVIGTFLMPHIGESFSRQELPKLAKIMNRVFNFEPVVKIKKAKIYVAGYHIGYVTGAAHKFIKDVLADKRIDRSRIVVTCCGCSVQYQEDIRKEIEKYGDFGEILFQKASASIAASTGREAFGIFYTIK